MRYFVRISFDGTDYFGWQVQPNKPTIQGELNAVLSKLLQEDIHITGCGRTDTGVHASQFYFHFDCNKKTPEQLIYKMNQMLTDSIVAHEIIPVKDSQHTRYDAVKRSYSYHIHFVKTPFLNRYSTYCYYKDLDIELMKKVAKSLTEYTNFEALSKTREDQNHSLCTIYSSEILYFKQENRLEYHVTANRFLHNMIRRTIGLILNIGRGKITELELHQALTKKEDLKLNTVSQPQGLFLTAVEYPFIPS